MDEKCGTRNRSSHSVTLLEWLHQPLSHSATLLRVTGPPTQPLSQSTRVANFCQRALNHIYIYIHKYMYVYIDIYYDVNEG